MGEQTVWGAGAPSRSPGFQEAAWGMIFFFGGLGCLAVTTLLTYTSLPYAFYGSMGCFAIGLILSGHALRRGAQPRSLCVTGMVLGSLALIAELGFVVFGYSVHIPRLS
jgi:hypothetical protein